MHNNIRFEMGKIILGLDEIVEFEEILNKDNEVEYLLEMWLRENCWDIRVLKGKVPEGYLEAFEWMSFEMGYPERVKTVIWGLRVEARLRELNIGVY